MTEHKNSTCHRLQMPMKLAFYFSLLLVFSATYGQQEFNDFKTLVSRGDIPADFTTLTSSKIKSDAAMGKVNLGDERREQEFLENIHGQIDNMLLSGSVIYGDEISTYVQAVASNLLKNEPDLLAKLRFYTIKSNETNALSTDQGIVFVTTGLITQLTSEAQLAFVLSHEIAHYTERHVLESFELQKDNINKRNRIEKLSSHSRENELEADRLALKRYNEAGYSVEEILTTFDVLMYSYLPFDDIAFPHSYFNSENLYIPEGYFADKTYEIKAEEDYNDETSSHPNIKKRKESITDAIGAYDEWGTTVNSLGEDRFNYIRAVSRFESLRTNVINVELSQALYSIFLLERDYPNSIYLNRMKALVWLSMVQLDSKNELNDQLPLSSTYEGESAHLYTVIRKLKDEEMMVVGLRTIYDIHKAQPEDAFVDQVYTSLIKELANSNKFEPENYSKVGFREAALKSLEVKDSLQVDTLPKSEPTRTKYDKIKTKKDPTTPSGFDSLRFSFYAIPDVIQDPDFIRRYNAYEYTADSIERLEDELDELTYRERKKIYKQRAADEKDEGIGLEKYILVEPTITFNTKKYKTALAQEEAQEVFLDAVEKANSKVGLDMTLVSHETLAKGETDVFNERSAYISYLEEAANYPDIELFPVDFEQLKALTAQHGTSKLMFTTVDYTFEPNISPGLLLYSAILFPTFPITLLTYLPIQIVNGQLSEYNTLVLDTNTGVPLTFEQDLVHSKPNKRINGVYYYHLLTKLKYKKSNA